MSEKLESNVTNISKAANAADEVRAKIVAVAEKATADDKKKVAALIADAKKGEYRPGMHTITAAMAAIIFLEHNPHNRDWDPAWSQELARRASAGQWENNGDNIRFYRDGQLADGQHRLAAIALSGHIYPAPIQFGIERSAVVTIDGAKRRFAADAAKLDGIRDAKTKQTIINITARYLMKSGDKTAALRSESEIAAAIKTNNELLDEAIEIGTGSLQNVVDPVLKSASAQALAYLMLTSAWSAQRVREKLALFQTGVSSDGEKTPYFVAAEVIKASRKKAESRDRLSTVKELGVTIYAMIAAERGIKALGSGACRGAVKKELPNPSYPGDALSEAA